MLKRGLTRLVPVKIWKNLSKIRQIYIKINLIDVKKRFCYYIEGILCPQFLYKLLYNISVVSINKMNKRNIGAGDTDISQKEKDCVNEILNFKRLSYLNRSRGASNFLKRG